MPIVYATAALILFAALFVMLTRGIAQACVWVYFPVAFFLICMPAIELSGIPDMSSVGAIGYALVLSLIVKRDELARLRFNALDAVMLAILGAAVTSTVLSEGAWGGVSATGKEFFVWVTPYLFGRILTLDPVARRDGVKVLCICAITLGGFALIEARLSPYLYSRLIEPTGIIKTTNSMTMARFGLMRAQVSTPHPIDLGNCGLLLGTAILALYPTVGRRWRDPLIIAGVIGAGLMVGGAISFTCFLGLAAAFALFVVFSRPVWGPRLVVPAMAGIIVMLIALTTYLLNQDVSVKPEAGTAEASLWIRTVIVQGSWEVATRAGLFGWGKKLPGDEIGVGSIDNAYMLFIMRRGWVYLILWGVLAVVMSFKAAAALGRARTPSERLPVAAAAAGLMATLVAMYTVWYGFLYAQMFVFVLGLLSSMCQVLRQPQVIMTGRESMPVYGGPPMAFAGGGR